jgi:hypothetical protein
MERVHIDLELASAPSQFMRHCSGLPKPRSSKTGQSEPPGLSLPAFLGCGADGPVADKLPGG